MSIAAMLESSELLMGMSPSSLHIESTDSDHVLLHTVKTSKNISIKMLKDVGMTVPKSKKTSAVYISHSTVVLCI